MAKVPPFHSTNQSDPDVYHDHDDCSRGKLIPPQNKEAGTNGWPQCKTCEELD
jgi:hypothetical protein